MLFLVCVALGMAMFDAVNIPTLALVSILSNLSVVLFLQQSSSLTIH